MKSTKSEMLMNSKMKGIKVDESMNEGEKDIISNKKSLLKSTMKNIREKLHILGSKILKHKSK